MSRCIAIVEDEAAIRHNYAEAMNKQGYQVLAYANRAEAEAGFAQQLPDLVLLDIGLEDEVDAGFELCRQLRSASSIFVPGWRPFFAASMPCTNRKQPQQRSAVASCCSI